MNVLTFFYLTTGVIAIFINSIIIIISYYLS